MSEFGFGSLIRKEPSAPRLHHPPTSASLSPEGSKLYIIFLLLRLREIRASSCIRPSAPARVVLATLRPFPPPDLDCGDIPYRNFVVLPPDPHHFDGDGDGIGCES